VLPHTIAITIVKSKYLLGLRPPVIARTLLTVSLLTAALGLLGAKIPSQAQAADVPIDLHGSLSGWGFSAGTISSPGPQITVNEGDTVRLRLFAADSVPHNFVLDYDGDRGADADEPASPTFSSPTTPTYLNFTASRAGSFVYWCTIHHEPMFGDWTTTAAPGANPPTASITWPREGQSVTGGVQRDITWALQDLDGDADLRVWVNLTVNATPTNLVSGVTGATSYSWSVPLVNASAVVRVEVLDSTGRSGFDQKGFTIDSTRPRVQSHSQEFSPPRFRFTFTEPMNPSTSRQDIAVQDLNVSLWLEGEVSWSTDGMVATFTPAFSLVQGRTYRFYANTSLLDKSEPGNPLAEAFVGEWVAVDDSPPGAPILDPLLVAAIAIPIAAAAAAVALVMTRRRRK
jgi:hypothetical protein